MITSESIAALAAALAQAQAVMSGAKKDSANPFFKSKYADLASCWEAARAALPGQGLCVIQTTRASEKEEVVVVTRLAHSSGEWVEGELPLPVSKADAQGFGSALTYARRYALCAIVGIAPEDDDGNLASAARPAKTLPNPIPANVEGNDLLAGMDPEERDFLNSQVKEINRLAAAKASDTILADYWDKQKFDDEEKLALSALLDSGVRAAIKRGQKATRAALLGSQA